MTNGFGYSMLVIVVGSCSVVVFIALFGKL